MRRGQVVPRKLAKRVDRAGTRFGVVMETTTRSRKEKETKKKTSKETRE